MSTTGPVTRAMRPAAPARLWTGAVAVSVMFSSFWMNLGYLEEARPLHHDFRRDLLRDLGLARLVGETIAGP